MITKKLMTIFVVSLALFMDVLDTNIINTAVPAMSNSLNINPIDLKIALISYFLSLAIFIPISGWLADKYGTKSIFISAIGLFMLSSFWCGYAHTLMELVIARLIQGIGGAFMLSLGRLIIARSFKRHELVEAMNAVIMVVSLGVMLGPFIGGVITDYLSWPWIFWVNIPAGLLAIFLAVYSLADTVTKKPQPFDWLGFILLGGSLALLCFALSEMSESHVSLYLAFLMFIVSLCLLMGFIWHAKKHTHPLININLFNRRTFRVSIMGNLGARLGFGGMPFLLPLLQQVSLGFSAKLSGLLLAPMAFGIIFSKLISFRILQRIGYRKFLIINTVFIACLLCLFQIITHGSSIYTIASLTFIFGSLMTAQFTAMNSLAFAEIKEEELSASTPITSTVQMLAQSFGVAVGAILLRFYSSYLSSLPLTDPTVFHRTFLTMGLITFISTIIFLNLRKKDGEQMLRAQPS